LNSVVAAAAEPAPATTTTTPPGTTTDQSTSANPTTISQFLNGGGQLNLGAAWPFFSNRTLSGDLASIFFLAPRRGGTLSTLGTTQEDASAFVDPGVEWHGAWVDGGQGTGLFFQLRSSYASGGKTFRDAIGVDHAFWYGTFAGGL